MYCRNNKIKINLSRFALYSYLLKFPQIYKSSVKTASIYITGVRTLNEYIQKRIRIPSEYLLSIMPALEVIPAKYLIAPKFRRKDSNGGVRSIRLIRLEASTFPFF